MKEMINGKTYNTEKAIMIAEITYDHPQGSDYVDDVDTLYRKRTGEYFIDSESLSDYDGDTVIKPISVAEAQALVNDVNQDDVNWSAAKELVRNE